MKRYVVIILTIFCCYQQGLAQYQARLNFNAKFEPTNKILHGAGQSNEIEFSSYADFLGNNRYPTIFMFYTTANRNATEQEDRMNEYLDFIDKHPDGVMPQIGLAFTRNGVEYANEVLSGQHDAGLIKMAQVLNNWGKPVFVRIGYEANGFWNAYSSSSYKQAFQYITNIFRSNASNIATVWCVHPITNLNNMMSYYPGDSYVDWWSIDLFEPNFLSSPNTQDYLDEAVLHSKPVMIGESCPSEVGVDGGQQSWNNWYVSYFNIIKNNPVIKAFCYINRNWKTSSSLPQWLDCRVYKNSTVGSLYQNELSNSIYQHVSVPSNYKIDAIQPGDDAYVRDGTYSSNTYDSQDPLRLRVKNSAVSGFTRESYISFDISGISNVTSARLWFFGRNDNTVDINTTVFEVSNNSWSENTLNYNNKPNTGNSLGLVEISDEDEEWGSLDVTTYVANATSGSKVSFAIINQGALELTLDIDSRETIDGNPPFLVIHSSSGSTTVSGQVTVSNSSDDAEQGSSTMDLTSGDLDFGEKLSGIRFTNVTIPNGAIIQNAYIQFTADNDGQNSNASYTIKGQDVNNAGTFTTATNNISNRTTTSASVSWNNVPAWNSAGQAGTNQRTPDISSIIQEIVNRGGWISGNNMVLMVDGTSGKRSAKTYDGDPSKAPKLVYTYTSSAGARALKTEQTTIEVNSLEYSELKLYPNPVSDYFKLELPEGSNEITILDVNGRVLKTIKAESRSAVISVTDLEPGIYILNTNNSRVRFIIDR
ncbi:CBM96 family carbohydrate-binding protein [Marinigracilibium pacificum]|uniref:DNRLRE domain-containing protein n=1 Tax=Marinigracilibium pacificum TaxID=2729599 RepID=A0A848IT97_9BACT|nr:DNRLRE domain-containing protein [Marinigracilibium pacificum]NMM47567.1 DNRLRE domain-containing protein [Marinigracilibium pacificum]